jgi:hypothetical protein
MFIHQLTVCSPITEASFVDDTEEHTNPAGFHSYQHRHHGVFRMRCPLIGSSEALFLPSK